MSNRRWFWIFLFIVGVVVVTTLATGWNLNLVRQSHERLPWPGIILGSLGFLATLIALVMLFIRLLLEMRMTQLQSEFLATVSHELKTPITTLELSSSLLRSTGSPEDRERLWESHAAELSRLKGHVDVLLEAARFQSGRTPKNLIEVDLDAWLDRSICRWRRMLGPHATLEHQGRPLAIRPLADERMLDLIMDNLIDNARKFAQGTPRVIVHTDCQGGHWTIRVVDQGWGFDPRESKRIFKRFTRVRVNAPYAIPGTGLGLYLARSASRAIGLVLNGSSPGPGRGATFTLQGRSRG